MSRDLQTIVDDLAATLHRPVGIDDAQFRSQAYSAHLEPADPVRLASILRREAPPEVRSWLIGELRVHEARGYVRVRANPDLGMAARVCVPVRFGEVLLGYLWLIDTDPPLTPEQLDHAQRASGAAANVLYENRFLESADREREQALLFDLLTGGRERSRAAAHELLAGGFLVSAAHYSVVVARPADPNVFDDDAVRVRLASAADQTRRTVDTGCALAISLDGAVAVVTSSDRLATAAALFDVARDTLHQAVCVGAGGSVSDLASVRSSLDQARLAGELAARLPEWGGQVDWERLGALQILALVAPEPWMWEILRPLLDERRAELLETLELYLRSAGNSAAAAAALHVHRTTLYHRLRKIEQLCGVDLDTGEDRFRLELSLRLLRLAPGGP
jgi:hypothetical protein